MICRLFRLFVPILLLTISGCSVDSQQELPFDVVEDGIAFPIGNVDADVDSIPTFVVFTTLAEVTQPVPGLNFTESARTHLRELDYNRSFAILVLRGQVANSGVVKEVIREGNKVIIRTSAIEPGPGSYAISGFTPPYQVISITKIGVWNENIHFSLERKGVGLVSESTVFVP